jgi:uncharacterized protein (DUF433 family)
MYFRLKPIEIENFVDMKHNMMRLKGYRIGIEHVIRCYNEGFSPEQISQEFPGVDLKIIYTILAFYLQNKNTLDHYINQQIFLTEQRMNQDDKKPPLPVVERLRNIRLQKEKEKHENSFFTGYTQIKHV